MPRTVRRIPSDEDKRKALARAREWKAFRKTYLFSQQALSEALPCSRRTIMAIEACETYWPTMRLLRRFRQLKQEQELKQKRYEMAVAS